MSWFRALTSAAGTVAPVRSRTVPCSVPVDAVVCATGFAAMTGSFDRMNIVGRGGLTLRKKWEAGPRAYLGLASAGFPNLFMITGPGSPSVKSNMITSIEQHVDGGAGAVAALDQHGARAHPVDEARGFPHVGIGRDRHPRQGFGLRQVGRHQRRPRQQAFAQRRHGAAVAQHIQAFHHIDQVDPGAVGVHGTVDGQGDLRLVPVRPRRVRRCRRALHTRGAGSQPGSGKPAVAVTFEM